MERIIRTAWGSHIDLSSIIQVSALHSQPSGNTPAFTIDIKLRDKPINVWVMDISEERWKSGMKSYDTPIEEHMKAIHAEFIQQWKDYVKANG
jgi:hypothetical protein